MLVDTGATRTIIRPDIVRGKGKTLTTTVRLRTASGDDITTHGQRRIAMDIGDISIECDVLVAEIMEEVILGMDVIKGYGFQLDMIDDVLRIGSREIPFRECEDAKIRVLLTEDVELRGQAETIVSGYLDRDLRNSDIRLVEPVNDKNLGKGLLVGKTLVRGRKEVPVRILNTNMYSVTLKKNTILGESCSVMSVTGSIDDGQNTTHKGSKCSQKLLEVLTSSCTNLEPGHMKEVKKLIEEYCDVFAIDDSQMGRTNLVKHPINTGNADPIRQHPRRLPIAKRDDAERIIKDMHDQGIIEPSDSPWSSPVVLVKKKDGSTRFCVDYRRLNEVTKKDCYPIPRIDDTLDTLSGSRWFSTLDLKSGYWQVELDAKDKEKTAFTIGAGLWQFTVMPFGLCNAPATFERLMETILRGLSWKTCLVYLDDVIVFGRTFDEHLRNLRGVFERLRTANLKLSPKKCHIFKKEVKYLGHVVSEAGVSADPDKVKVVREWPTPTDKHQVRSFLGLCTYYRKFVLGFANIAKPLTKLTEDGRDFVWDADCQDAFGRLKQALTTAPILSYPQTSGKFILDTDASNTAIGGVLSQVQNGQEKVIGYFSKVLSKPERNYCVTRRELLAAVKSMEHFYKYLYGREFLLRTDHAALKWLLQFKNPEGQVARWIERLQEYNFTVEHRAGKSHNNADALSRRPCPSDCKHCSKIEEKEFCLRTTVMNEDWLPKTLQKDQEDDPELKLLLDWKTKGQRPRWEDVSPLNSRVKSYWAQWDSLILEDGLLKRSLETEEGASARNQLVIPRSRVPEVLRKLHDETSGGHFGIKKTLEKVRERFYWVNCKEDVKDWCRKCRLCASSNGPRGGRRAPMRQYNVGSPLERVAIDIAGPFPETEDGNKYILVAMDYFTKWVEAYAIPNQEASTVADVLVKEMFSRFGVPLELHSDQGRNFESSLFQGVCELLGIKKTRTTALHPQSDGMVERMNRTVGKYLTKVVSDHQRDWDKYLHLFTMAYRSSVQESTGETPACIMFGREMRLPCDLEFGCKPGVEIAGGDYVSNLKGRLHYIHERVRQNLQIASDRMKTRYDSKAAEGGFKAGDLVWLYNPQRRRGLSPKLQKDWEGPYKVIKRINDVVFRIQKLPKGKKRVVHVNRLAKYEADYDSRDETRRINTLKKEQEEMSFDRFMANYGETGRARFGITTEQQQDLFSVPEEYSLAHCVAEDLRMSRGIASVFRKKFGRVSELVDQQPRSGRTLRLSDGERHLFYLVTKRFSHGKPTYGVMWDTLLNLRSELTSLGVKKLAVPKLGCGLDQLNWRIVRNMLEVIFQRTGIQILVCSFNPRGCSAAGKTVECYFQQQGRCRMGDTCRFSHSFQGVRRPNVLRRGQCNVRAP